jgi:hypothetical protein
LSACLPQGHLFFTSLSRTNLPLVSNSPLTRLSTPDFLVKKGAFSSLWLCIAVCPDLHA